MSHKYQLFSVLTKVGCDFVQMLRKLIPWCVGFENIIGTLSDCVNPATQVAEKIVINS